MAQALFFEIQQFHVSIFENDVDFKNTTLTKALKVLRSSFSSEQFEGELTNVIRSSMSKMLESIYD